MKERIKAVKEYLKYFPNDPYANNNLLLCEYADELGIELEGKYYPRIEYGYCVINRQIKVGKRYCLTNSETKYKQNGKENIIIWSEPSGRLAFVSDKYWYDVQNEWDDFMNILKSYGPLDYDGINNVYIYDLKHGKKLIENYKDIVQDFKKKIDKRIKEVEFENKKKELERLRMELGES
jgi:hypothetical protein